MPLQSCELRTIKTLLRRSAELLRDAHELAVSAGDTLQAANLKNLMRRLADEQADVERRIGELERAELRP